MRIGLTCVACALAAVGAARAQTATESVILSFANFPRGANPYAPLLAGTGGALYGTASAGGQSDLGVVFELAGGSYKVLYSFKGGSDGGKPYAGVAQDAAGNLYGTTYQGGTANAGVVYKLTPSGQETVLYSFTGGADGGNPYAGVIVDAAGNLYGTTYAGGATSCTGGCGVVYKLSPTGLETVLHSFTGTPDGANPYAGVIADSSGNLYGTTYGGGVGRLGAVYRLTPAGQETVLFSFGKGSGAGPYGGVIRDPAGNLYGTTSYGNGVVYKLDSAGHYTVLYTFPGPGPSIPGSGLLQDSAGNLYGTTESGGTANAGAVYMLSPAGDLSTLYSFPGSTQPIPPAGSAGVIRDSSGSLYGTTAYAGPGGMVYKVDAAGQETTLYSFSPAPGGTGPGSLMSSGGSFYGTTGTGGAANAGVVYRVDAAGHETVLYSFTGGADGGNPSAGVSADSAGNLYGTTLYGGLTNCYGGCGVVYKVDQSGQETVLYSFTGGTDGVSPYAGVVLDSAGNLYGTAYAGGTWGRGVVYKVDAAGQERVLHAFRGTDGSGPQAGVIRDAAGNLYGTTFHGGNGYGVVYKVDPAGQETVLYTFTSVADGANPGAGVIRDPQGNLYGTTVDTVYELSAAGQYTVLHAFTGSRDGFLPSGGVIRDRDGNLYGATIEGGTRGCNLDLGCGVVYKVEQSGQYTVLHSFSGGTDGAGPDGLIFGSGGSLYGTAGAGGAQDGGVLFKLSLQ